jgi:DNA-binding transcriptional LysR family regulator
VKHKTQIMNNLPLLNDLRVFMLVARRAGFAAAAEELGVSPAFVSKRISLLEQTLNVLLLHRTTRRVTITEEGERIYEWAQRILQDVDQMMDELPMCGRCRRGRCGLSAALALAAGWWRRRCRRWPVSTRSWSCV